MATAAAAVAGALALAWRRVVRIEVQGPSMAPTLCEGDRMVALAGLRGRPGDIVAIGDPRAPSRLLVKRVACVEADRHLHLRGDDPSTSTDSRSFGAVSPALLVGRVVWRYWPPDRRGRLDPERSPPKASQAFR